MDGEKGFEILSAMVENNLWPANFEQKIGFDKIRDLLFENCKGELGMLEVEQMYFVSDSDLLKVLLGQVNDFKQILLSESEFPNGAYENLISNLNRLRPFGSVISLKELFDLKLTLETIDQILKFFTQSRKEKYHYLAQIVDQIYLPELLLKDCLRIVDDKGEMRDNASNDLLEIRRKLRSKISGLRSKTIKCLQHAKENSWARADAEATIRDGRAVIPLHVSDKRKMKGFIHDESISGHTAFVEPAELFEANNEIRELKFEEKREIHSILVAFTDLLRPEIDGLIDALIQVGIMDFVRAKARLAVEIKAVLPIFSLEKKFSWIRAIHPLLFLSHKQSKLPVVPLTIELTNESRILIISGPNAGGKSVCLKTVGLLQYMLQCGLLIPLNELSEVCLFKQLFLDIGDEQSIENDLSTYSSHLTNIKYFIENTNSETLILIDEFGSGTEPGVGGAIAEAALENLNSKGAFAVITTHYSNLKALANNENGIVNGAMLYDTQALKPLYTLSIGEPGSSFAFEIARKIGMPEEILISAYSKSAKPEIDLETRLSEVSFTQNKLNSKLLEVEQADKLLSELIERYQSQTKQIEHKKREIIGEARQKAKEVLSTANQLIENTIREIKESKAEKVQTVQTRQQFEKSKDELLKVEEVTPIVPIAKNQKSVSIKVDNLKTESYKNLKVGDYARLIGQETVGVIDSMNSKMAVISLNNLVVSCKLENLEKVLNYFPQKPKNKGFNSIMQNINLRAENFSPSVDIRGKRADEALEIVKKLIDEAALLSYRELEVLHGTGNGILRHIIRDYLSAQKDIKSFGDAKVEFGGSGKTIINL